MIFPNKMTIAQYRYQAQRCNWYQHTTAISTKVLLLSPSSVSVIAWSGDTSTVSYDIRKPIENLPFTPTEDDVIFNFAAVHRNPGHEDHEYFETNIRGTENVVAFAEKWQNGDAAHRQLTIVRSCVVFSIS